jgi:hypothetical protein
MRIVFVAVDTIDPTPGSASPIIVADGSLTARFTGRQRQRPRGSVGREVAHQARIRCMSSPIDVHDAVDETAFDADHRAVADGTVIAQFSGLIACWSRDLFARFAYTSVRGAFAALPSAFDLLRSAAWGV